MQQESGTTRIIDPWGGSYHVERLTSDLSVKALEHIAEVDRLGGMAKAIEAGIPKRRIEEAAARTQARIDAGRQIVVGVNRFRPQDEPPHEVLRVDNCAVRAAQIDKLKRLRAERDQAATEAALTALTEAARSGRGNLLALSVEAARAKATVGEISLALETVFGRFGSDIDVISGVYAEELGAAHGLLERGRRAVAGFAANAGRPPRILVAKVGQDGHDRGQKVIASAFADLGFEVEIGPLFQTPEEAATLAIDKDVHIVGVSSLSGRAPYTRAGAQAGARGWRAAGHHGGGRRGDPGGGLRGAPRRRRGGDFRARDGGRGGCGNARRRAQPAARLRAPASGRIFPLDPEATSLTARTRSAPSQCGTDFPAWELSLRREWIAVRSFPGLLGWRRSRLILPGQRRRRRLLRGVHRR